MTIFKLQFHAAVTFQFPHAAPPTHEERALGALSHCFCFGGRQITVLSNRAISESMRGRPSWQTTAWKIALFVAVLPLTSLFFFGYCVLLYRYNKRANGWSISALPSEHIPRREELEKCRVFVEEGVAGQSETLGTDLTNKFDIDLTHKISELEKKQTELAREMCSFSVNIWGKSFDIKSAEERDALAKEIRAEALKQHSPQDLRFPDHKDPLDVDRIQQAELSFINELPDTDTHCISFGNLWYRLIPKPIKTTLEGEMTRHQYANGVIEEISAFNLISVAIECKPRCIQNMDSIRWIGKRTYPNGAIEKGEFVRCKLWRGVLYEPSPEKRVLYLRGQRGWSAGEQMILRVTPLEGEDRWIFASHASTTIKKPLGAEYYVEMEREAMPRVGEFLLTLPRIASSDLIEILEQFKIDLSEFTEELVTTGKILSLKATFLEALLTVLDQKKIQVDLKKTDPKNKQKLLTCFLGNPQIVKALLARDKKFFKEWMVATALGSNQKESAEELLSFMKDNDMKLSVHTRIYRKIAVTHEEFTKQESEYVKYVHRDTLTGLYKLANIYANAKIAKDLRPLIQKSEKLAKQAGPSILACDMDAAEMRETIQSFLDTVRENSSLLRKAEFEKFHHKDYIYEGNIESLVGGYYLEQAITKLKFNNVRVVRSAIVLDAQCDTLRVGVEYTKPSEGGDYRLKIFTTKEDHRSSVNQLRVHRQQIKTVARILTPDELSEILILCRETGYIGPNKILIGQDKVYIGETEFEDFASPNWRFLCHDRYSKMIDQFLSPFQGNPAFNSVIQNFRNQEEKEYEAYINSKEKFDEEEEKQRELRSNALKESGCIFVHPFNFTTQELGMDL
jgi:hypothetical protein